MLIIRKLLLGAMMLLLICVQMMAQDSNSSASITNAEKPGPSFEADLFLPLLGVSDLKVIIPTRCAGKGMLQGSWVFGLYADYAWGGLTRPVNDFGKVRTIAAKVGWRQFFWKGLHLDATVNVGQRHEEHNIYDGTTLNSFVSRAWILGGWQGNITNRVYYNLRGGAGIHLIRKGDRYASTERKVIPAFDVNIGVRF